MARILTPGKIRKKVFRAMGLGRGPLVQGTQPRLQRYFEPFSSKQYPTNRSADASRVPMEFGARQWGHTEFLQNALKSPAIARQIARDPIARIEFEKAIFDALQERALKAYSEEWSALSPKTISTLIERAKRTASKPTPALANEHNARMVAQEAMQRLQKGKMVTIFDLGCGGGGTIIPIIDSIPQESRHKIQVVLIDVMPTGLKSTARKLMRRGLVGKGQIIAIKENISKLMGNDRIARLFGTADIITSGAALHHVSAIEPTFEGVKRLLKKDGAFIFWDWGHTAWRAPNLVIAPEGARVDKYGRFYEQGTRTTEAGKKTAFVSRGKIAGISGGRAPTEYQTAREMLSTWIKLLHFSEERKQGFLEWFDRKALRGEPINFAEYLKRVEGAQLEKGMPRAELKYWEGHRPPELYHDAMRNVGLIGENKKPFTIYSTQSPLLYQIKVRKG
ncbi:MAG: methyltransferase [Candidatus Micrarchaeota archaeon]